MPSIPSSTEIAENVENCKTIALIRSGRVADTFHVRIRSADYCLRVLRPDLLDDRNSILQFRNEYKALTEIDHSGFLKASGWKEVNGVSYYFTEYFPHDTLREIMPENLELRTRQLIFRQLVEACSHLHDRNMVHFGVKPENILYANGKIKLVQVGQVRFLDEDLEYPDLFGTEGYTDPKILAGYSNISKCSDVYSVSAVGVFLFEKECSSHQQALPELSFGEVLKRGLDGDFDDCSQMLASMTETTGVAMHPLPTHAGSTDKSQKKFILVKAIAALVALLGLYWAWPSIAKRIDLSASKPSSLQDYAALLDLQKPPPALPHIAENSEFWQFIDALNKLPPDATPQAVAVYNAQGVANPFPFKQMGEQSVLGDLERLKEHYVTKYASTAPLVVPSSFGADYKAMFSQCWKLLGELAVKKDTTGYVAEFRNWVVVCDYMATYGNMTDKKFALELMRKLYSTAMFNVSRIDSLETSLVYRSVEDIYIPLMDSFREEVSDLDLRYVSSVLKSVADKGQYANFLKWALRNKFDLYENPNNFDLYDTLVIESNNLFIDVGLFEYAIYWVHCCYGKIKLGAPFDQAIEQNFKHKIKQNALLEQYRKLKQSEI